MPSKPLLRLANGTSGRKEGITKALFLPLHSLGLDKIWSKMFHLLLFVFSSGDLISIQGPGRDQEKGGS